MEIEPSRANDRVPDQREHLVLEAVGIVRKAMHEENSWPWTSAAVGVGSSWQ